MRLKSFGKYAIIVENQQINKFQINQSTNRTNMKKFDIHDRIFRFVIEVLKLIKYIPQTVENKIIINQFVRSVTSVGANDQEADGVSSRKDFIHCYTIVRKELKETRYWLSILSELDSKLRVKFSNSIKENDELIKIISSIISKTAVKIS